eukprot:762419-Hanusia_phi.AAC.8
MVARYKNALEKMQNELMGLVDTIDEGCNLNDLCCELELQGTGEMSLQEKKQTCLTELRKVFTRQIHDVFILKEQSEYVLDLTTFETITNAKPMLACELQCPPSDWLVEVFEQVHTAIIQRILIHVKNRESNTNSEAELQNEIGKILKDHETEHGHDEYGKLQGVCKRMIDQFVSLDNDLLLFMQNNTKNKEGHENSLKKAWKSIWISRLNKELPRFYDSRCIQRIGKEGVIGCIAFVFHLYASRIKFETPLEDGIKSQKPFKPLVRLEVKGIVAHQILRSNLSGVTYEASDFFPHVYIRVLSDRARRHPDWLFLKLKPSAYNPSLVQGASVGVVEFPEWIRGGVFGDIRVPCEEKNGGEKMMSLTTYIETFSRIFDFQTNKIYLDRKEDNNLVYLLVMSNANLHQDICETGDDGKSPLSVYVGKATNGLIQRWLMQPFSHCIRAAGAANASSEDEMRDYIQPRHGCSNVRIFHLYLALSKIRQNTKNLPKNEEINVALFILESRDGTVEGSEEIYIQELKRAKEGQVFNVM